MFQDLPPELLTEIVSYLPTARSVHNLALTSKRLHVFVEKEGWKTFTRQRFPSVPVSGDYRDAAHGLTTLSRNWDRRAFLAKYLEPHGRIVNLQTGATIPRWTRPKGQTMGFQPSIDSYEEHDGQIWGRRKQVLAYSAGTEMLLRTSMPDRQPTWLTWKLPGGIEGRDDITSLKLMRPHQTRNAGEEAQSVVLGTASGHLFRLRIDLAAPTYTVEPFVTHLDAVRSTDISSSSSPLLAACLSDSRVALYSCKSEPVEGAIGPVSSIDAAPEGKRGCRAWSTRFLSETALAVGIGPHSEPVQVYSVTPTGISDEPLRRFGLDGTHWRPNDGIQIGTITPERQSSVYPIVPLPASSVAGHGAGQVFLSGCYDGLIRLHDMRSPNAFDASFWDPNDDSAIYSLQNIARERLVAGSSRYGLLKFWDIRGAGGRAYHYADIDSKIVVPDSWMPNGTRSFGWNVFLNPRNRNSNNGRQPRQTWRDRRSVDSPVYSLSSPSPTSTSIFAGVENNIVQLDFVSMLDRHPDPVFRPAIKRIPKTGDIDIKRTWNPHGDILNLAMYEQTQSSGGAVRLKAQAGIGRYPASLPGYDERWKDGSES